MFWRPRWRDNYNLLELLEKRYIGQIWILKQVGSGKNCCYCLTFVCIHVFTIHKFTLWMTIEQNVCSTIKLSDTLLVADTFFVPNHVFHLHLCDSQSSRRSPMSRQWWICNSPPQSMQCFVSPTPARWHCTASRPKLTVCLWSQSTQPVTIYEFILSLFGKYAHATNGLA